MKHLLALACCCNLACTLASAPDGGAADISSFCAVDANYSGSDCAVEADALCGSAFVAQYLCMKANLQQGKDDCCSDADCVAVASTLDCAFDGGSTYYEACPTALNQNQQEAFNAELATLKAQFCSRRCLVTSGTACIAHKLRCSQHRCVAFE